MGWNFWFLAFPQIQQGQGTQVPTTATELVQVLDIQEGTQETTGAPGKGELWLETMGAKQSQPE